MLYYLPLVSASMFHGNVALTIDRNIPIAAQSKHSTILPMKHSVDQTTTLVKKIIRVLKSPRISRFFKFALTFHQFYLIIKVEV